MLASVGEAMPPYAKKVIMQRKQKKPFKFNNFYLI